MLGIDLDKVNWYILCKAKYELIYLFGKDNVKIYKTFKGYHVRVNVNLPFDKATTLRIYFYGAFLHHTVVWCHHRKSICVML